MPINILTLSSLYPNKIQPRHGVFIENRTRNLFQSGKVSIKVVAPVPWFPVNATWAGKYAILADIPGNECRHELNILHPRYPVIPKVGMTISPFLLAASLVCPLSRIISRGYDFDIIDAYYFYPDGVAAAILGRYFGKPVIISALGSDVNVISKYRAPRSLIKWAAGQADAITTVCQSLKDELVDVGVDENKIRVILHGVDMDIFYLMEDRVSLRRQLGLKRKTLLMVGNLIELKGHKLVLQAMQELKELDLLIIGNGEEEDNLKKLARSLGISDRVRFLGYIAQDKLRVYYNAADMLIMPSSSEGIPNVLMESIACGTPVVATRIGGMPEILEDCRVGVLMDSRSVEALIDAVHRLFSESHDRRNVSSYAERYSWAHTTEQHLEIFNEILL